MKFATWNVRILYSAVEMIRNRYTWNGDVQWPRLLEKNNTKNGMIYYSENDYSMHKDFYKSVMNFLLLQRVVWYDP